MFSGASLAFTLALSVASTTNAFSLFKSGTSSSTVSIENTQVLASLTRGVPDYLNDKYSSDYFICDGVVKLDQSQLNDEFCDCLDGSDEPGTNACSNGVFHCVNKGFKITTLPASRVDDQVCDCCDGSDEGVYAQCPNTCNQAAEREKEAMSKIRNAYATGSAIRSKLMETTSAELNALIAQLPKAEADTAAFQASYDAANKKLSEAKSMDEESRSEQKRKKKAEILTALDADSWSVSQVSTCLSNLLNVLGITEKDDVRLIAKLDEVTEFLSTTTAAAEVAMDGSVTDLDDPYGETGDYGEHYPPYGDDDVLPPSDDVDLDVPAAEVADGEKPCVLVTSASDPRLMPLCKEGQDHLERAKEFLLSVIKSRSAFREAMLITGFFKQHKTFEGSASFALNSLADSASGCPNGLSAEICATQATLVHLASEREALNTVEPFLQQQFDAQQKEADAIRQQLVASQEVKKKAENAKKDMEFYKDNLEFLALKNQCYSMMDGKYKYEVCILGDVTQQEEGGGNKVTLGKFDTIDEGRTEKGAHFLTMHYAKGTHCHVHGARKADVSVTCAAEHALLSTSEPAICSYALEFESPLACTPEYAKIHGLDPLV